MKSFKNRFKGRELEILNCINEHGGRILNLSVMEKYDAKDIICWEKYIRKIAEEHDFKFVEESRRALPEYFRPTDLQLATEYAGIPALIKARARIDAQIARKRKRIEELEQRIAEEERALGEDYEPERALI